MRGPESEDIGGGVPRQAGDVPPNPNRSRIALPASMRWLPFAFAIGIGVVIAGWLLTFVTGYSGKPMVGTFTLGWMILAGEIFLVWVLYQAVRLMLAKVHSPTRELLRIGHENRWRIATAAIGLALAGVTQMGFNWVKPQIPMLVGFSADPMLADLDKALFFGTDPWIPLHAALGEGLPYLGVIYSMWFPITIIALVGIFIRNHQAAIVAYFLLWGVFGTVFQALCSAAGPIFWRRIGLGDRFDAMIEGLPYSSTMTADYLWASHVAEQNNIAVGISAMPSMHVAFAAWVFLAYRDTKLVWLAAFYFAAISVGSVALGWHYALDGLVGAAGALGCLWLGKCTTGFPMWPGTASATSRSQA